jgi:HTH-type transcriptional regulator/antitoxin HigA
MKPLRPLRSERDYEAALREIDRLFRAKPGTAACDRMEVLVTLVEKYEEQHYPMPPPDPIAAIRFHMEQKGLTRADLAPLIGGRGRVSEILGRKRALTLPMIRRLHRRWGIPADVLIRESRRRNGARASGR